MTEKNTHKKKDLFAFHEILYWPCNKQHLDEHPGLVAQLACVKVALVAICAFALVLTIKYNRSSEALAILVGGTLGLGLAVYLHKVLRKKRV